MPGLKQIAALCALGLMTVGCQNKVAKERDALYQQTQELQSQLDDSRSQLASAPDPAEVAMMRQTLAQREAEIAQLQDSLRQQPANAPKDPALEGIETSFNNNTGELTVTLPGDVLFSSGQAELKPSSKATLDKVVKAIKEKYPGKQIYVNGHTDSDPISKTKDKWDDNHTLAFARAKAVMGYLEKAGISEKNMVIGAYGPNSPKANKAASRRVEIVVATR